MQAFGLPGHQAFCFRGSGGLLYLTMGALLVSYLYRPRNLSRTPYGPSITWGPGLELAASSNLGNVSGP